MSDFIIIHEGKRNFKFTMDSLLKNIEKFNYVVVAPSELQEELQEEPSVIFHGDNKSIAAALNEAVELINEDIAFIVKAGCYVTRTAVEAMELCAEDEEIGLVMPRLNSFFVKQKFEFKNIQEEFVLKEAKILSNEEYEEKSYTKDVDDNFIAFKRKDFYYVGGFDTTLNSLPVIYKDYLLGCFNKGLAAVVAKDALAYSRNICDERELYGKEALKLERKLGFNFNSYNHIKKELNDFIVENPYEDLNILEVGAGPGYTLMCMKNKFKYANVTGLEADARCLSIAPPFVALKIGDYLDTINDLEDEAFDYIFCHNIIEKMENPWEFLKRCRAKLSPAGKLVASMANANHISVIGELLNGLFQYKNGGILDINNLRFFTLNTMMQLFNDTGYVVSRIGGIRSGGPGEEDIIKEVLSLSLINKEWQQPVDLSAQMGVLLFNLICTKAGE